MYIRNIGMKCPFPQQLNRWHIIVLPRILCSYNKLHLQAKNIQVKLTLLTEDIRGYIKTHKKYTAQKN